MKKSTKILLVILLCIELGVQLFLAKTDSQTTDEGVHIAAGYTYLTKHDYRFNPEHPLLVKLLSALPLTFMNLNTPSDDLYWNKSADYFYDSWRENRDYAEDFFYNLGNDPNKMLFYARFTPVLITVLLGLTIFLIAKHFWGERSAIIALVLYVLNPTVLAHGHLVTTDVAVSLGFLLVLYNFYRLSEKISFKRILWLGLSLAVAFLSKFTAVILVPCILGLLIYWLAVKKINARKFWQLLWSAVLAAAIMMVFVMAMYCFDFRPSSISQQNAISNETSKLKAIVASLPAKNFFKGLSMVVGHTQTGHSAYLLGQTSKVGWWYYFPVIFASKTNIFFLILFAFGVYMSFRQKDKTGFSQAAAVFAIVYFLFAMSSKANLGIRHILPIFPLIILFISAAILNKNKKVMIFTYVALLGIALETLLAFPYYLSYFNPIFGGEKNGYKVASDSNADWGQDLYRIKNFLSDNQQEAGSCSKIFVNYGWVGEEALDYYSIKRSSLSESVPTSGDCFIIGATAYVSADYAWLKSSGIDYKISPTAFWVKIK